MNSFLSHMLSLLLLTNPKKNKELIVDTVFILSLMQIFILFTFKGFSSNVAKIIINANSHFIYLQRFLLKLLPRFIFDIGINEGICRAKKCISFIENISMMSSQKLSWCWFTSSRRTLKNVATWVMELLKNLLLYIPRTK